MDVSACSNVTEKKIANVAKLFIHSSLTVTGGTPETRAKVLISRSAQLIEQFVREGQT